MVNEGEQTLAGNLSLGSAGSLEYWNPLTGSIRPWPGRVIEGRTHTWLCLERRQGVVLVVDPQGEADPAVTMPPLPGEIICEIAGPWHVTDEAGQPVSLPCPGDWAKVREWEIFSGRLRFMTQFDLSPEQAEGHLFLDLGQVGDIAEVILNGQAIGSRAWGPYVFDLGQACRSGGNMLEVRVTNSMANAYDGLQLPSGLMGPVVLRDASRYEFE